MSEQLTTLFEQLHGSRPPAPFASPDQVRRRGHQRTHRQALAAGTAVLAVAGLGTGWITVGTSGGPADTPSASPSSSPPSSSPSPGPSSVGPEVPASAMLRPADFQSRDGVRTEELDDQGPDGPNVPWADECPAYRAADYPSLAQRRGARGLSYVDPAAPNGWIATHIVERYPDAAANMADVRRVLEVCGTYQYPGGVEIRQTIVEEAFAGDDSLLVKIQSGSDIGYAVVVRVADMVSTLRYATDDEAEARAMAVPMANRLR